MVTATPRQIILISQVFYPDLQSNGQLFTPLLTEIASSGRTKVTVICGFPSSLRDQSVRISRREIYRNIHIHRCGLLVDGKKSMFMRLVAYISFVLHTSLVLLLTRQKDAVLGVSNPPFMAIVLWFVSIIGRFDYDFMLLDVYPEGLFATGLLNPRSISARCWKGLNRRSYRRARRLIVLGRDMKALLCETYGVMPDRIVWIPLWSVVEQAEPLPFCGESMAGQLGLQEKFVVQYSGNMGLWHDIESFVRAAADLQSESHIHFLFIGGGMRRAPAEALSLKLALNNVTWIDFVPKDMLARSLACCHLSLISLRQGLEGVAVPSKLYGILASARAIVAQVPNTSEVAKVVSEEKCGVVVAPGDHAQLVHAIRELSRNITTVDSMGRNSLKAYESKYTLRQAIVAFENFWGITSTLPPGP